ncbi:sugar ABC transporter permease [Paenibacillus sp. J5C_2022]|uniref:carbohydrate ABC transporter permease n=1 Tax=Paenibacillus sp. J5C2022 TaxID=2977129 RepID=UPI0021CEB4A0|nr:sugar ABC transporter permease [Paenibacillus sp. J5C2022]MCU6710561.1 sugar ABC transporter permease [Paenibacillus sp. J5C2022]
MTHSPFAAADRVSPRKGRDWLKKARTQRILFLAIAITPAFGGYLLFTLYPNLLSVYYSLLNWNGISEPEFVGLDNYVSLFQDKYVWRALLHNLFFMAVVPVAVIFISLLLGYLLANKGYRGTPFFKILFFFPNVLSTVVISLLWAFIYDGSFGLLNGLLRLLGIPIGNYYWLGESATALAAIVPPYVWGGVGLYVIIFMNAMATIPKSLYESAVLEGAGHMTRLFRITMPLIMPVIRVSALFLVLGSLKGFEKQLILTNGGPAGSTDVIGLYIFNLAFGAEYHNYGYASAVGMFLFVILVTAKLLMDKYLPDRAVEY